MERLPGYVMCGKVTRYVMCGEVTRVCDVWKGYQGV